MAETNSQKIISLNNLGEILGSVKTYIDNTKLIAGNNIDITDNTISVNGFITSEELSAALSQIGGSDLPDIPITDLSSIQHDIEVIQTNIDFMAEKINEIIEVINSGGSVVPFDEPFKEIDISGWKSDGTTWRQIINGINWDTDSIVVNLTEQLPNNQNESVLSLGLNISSWAGNNIHNFITKQEDGTIQFIGAVVGEAGTNNNMRQRYVILDDSDITIIINKHGIYVNDQYIFDDTQGFGGHQVSGNMPIDSAVQVFNNITAVFSNSIILGSEEGDGRFTGTYNFARIYHSLNLEEIRAHVQNGSALSLVSH